LVLATGSAGKYDEKRKRRDNPERAMAPLATDRRSGASMKFSRNLRNKASGPLPIFGLAHFTGFWGNAKDTADAADAAQTQL